MLQQLTSSPQMNNLANSMGDSPDLGSLMQSMMPMVSQMLGGMGGGGGTTAQMSGSSIQQGGAQNRSAAPSMSVLQRELTPDEAARWASVIRNDEAALALLHDDARAEPFSEAYTAAGAPAGCDRCGRRN